MPIYEYKCPVCGLTIELYRQMGRVDRPVCQVCQTQMGQQVTFPAMVKIKGAGGYPSRRKFVAGSAPFTSRTTKVWGNENPFDDINYMGTDSARRNIEQRKEVGDTAPSLSK